MVSLFQWITERNTFKLPSKTFVFKHFKAHDNWTFLPKKVVRSYSKVATISKDKIREIAEMKMPDLNAASIEAAMSMIAGTARCMGIVVEE